MGPFQVMSRGPGTYCLDLLPSMASICPWFHNSLFKPAEPQCTGPPALADDSYKVQAIFQINKHGKHDKVKSMGYDSSQNQWIPISELQDIAPEVVKTFFRWKEQKRVRLRPGKRT